MNKLVDKNRVLAMVILLVVLVTVYTLFLYQRMIIQGEIYYSKDNQITTETVTVTATRGNILDRYGRVLVSNKEIYNLSINAQKLFNNEDPNRVILELVDMVESYGDTYTDDLPITAEPPFAYTEDMTDIQRTMLKAYFKRQGLDDNTTAVELMSYMRTRYSIDNNYSAAEMRIIAGVRYSINVRYAINTADYVFVKDASMELISSILEQKLVGIEVSRGYTRYYSTEYAAHILGYVGLMTQEEFERYSLLNYANDAMVGKDGIEYAFEDVLHGKDGSARITKNSAGTILSTSYTDEAGNSTEPEPGHHIYLTIDIALQEQVERILNNTVSDMVLTRNTKRYEEMERGEYNPEMKDEITGAAAVVVDVNTGEPLAMASWPTYDPSNVIENYSALMEAENTPLFNRVLQGTYAIGSTFKPCTAIAALSEGYIDTEFKVDCEGVFTKYSAAGYAPECWIWSQGYTHDEENVVTGLRDSCNYFFYTIGDQLGVDLLGEYAHNFGLGVSTGIELIEATGNMANQANHMEYAGQEWRIGDTLQSAIGQSDSIFTPLQVAEYCATVANGGQRHTASILKAIRSFDYSTITYEREATVISEVKSEDYNWDAVHQGMREVVASPLNEVNWKNFIDCQWKVAGKTGTAQKGENITNDAIFICYAPYDNPQVAIAVIVERGRSGASVGHIARQILDAYINIKSYSDSSEEEMTLLR